MEKETKEETYNRCINEILELHSDHFHNCESVDEFWSKHDVELAELYRLERNRIEAPSDDEIQRQSLKWDDEICFELGAKWAIKHFTEE